MGEQLSLFTDEELRACAATDTYHYTEDDEVFIRRHHLRRTDREMAEVLVRTPGALRKKRQRLGLKKNKQ